MRGIKKLAAAAILVAMSGAVATAEPPGEFRYFRMGAGGMYVPPSDDGTQGNFEFAISGPRTVYTGRSYVYTTTVRNAQGPVEFSVLSGQLPQGLSLDPAHGTLSGNITAPGASQAVIAATDLSSGATATAPLSIRAVDPVGAAIVAPDAGLGEPYAAAVQTSGGAGQVTFALASGPLPPGLALSAAGAITGVPTSTGLFGGIAIRATDGLGTSAMTPVFAIKVADRSPLSISWTPQANWLVGDNIAASASPSGGDPRFYTWSVQGQLPTGATLDRTSGQISGVLTAPGTFGPVTLGLTDGIRSLVSAPVLFAVTAPVVSVKVAAPVTAVAGSAFAGSITATGAHAPYTFAVTRGGLPGGVTVSGSGEISGTPKIGSQGSYTFAVAATDRYGSQGTSDDVHLEVTPPPLTIAQPAVLDGYIGVTIDLTFAAAGGSGEGFVYAWSGAESLPPGMQFDTATGRLSGMPYDYYDQTIKVSVTDSIGNTTSTNPFRLHIAGPLAMSGIPQQDAAVGTYYQATQPRAYGGSEEGYVYDVFSGALPAGLTLGSSGFVSGIPTQSGSFDNLRIRVRDSAGASAISAAFSIVVQPSGNEVDPVSAAFTTVALPLRVGTRQNFAITLEGYGGHGGPYEFHADPSLPLPAGVTVNRTTGTISGTIAATGTYPLRVVVVDVSQSDKVSGYSEQGNIVVSPFLVGTAPDPAIARLGEAVNIHVVATGRPGPFTYSLGSGALPDGVTLDGATGALVGTPTAIGEALVTFVATDTSTGISIESAQIALQVAPAGNACYASGTIGPGAETGYYVMATPFVSNLLEVDSYAVNWSDPGHDVDGEGAPLPEGTMWISSAGVLAGPPSSTGVSGPITITPQSSTSEICADAPAAGPFTVTTVDGLSFDTFDLPPAAAGQPYSTTLRASAGKPSTSASGYWFSLAMDQDLPPGLSLNAASGELSGSPQKPGTYQLDFTVTDAWGFQAVNTLSLTVY